MLVQEMHIQVNQRLQEVASHKRDKYYPEEIDMALNKAMFRLLEKGVETKFQDIQINLSHVTALLQKNKVNEVIIPADTEQMYQDGTPLVYSVIPNNFYWLVNSRVEVLTDPVNCTTAPTLATKTLVEYVYVINFPKSTKVSAPYYGNLNISSTIVATVFHLPSQVVSGFNSPNSHFTVVNLMLEYQYRYGIKAYWERYRDTFYSNSLILVSPSDLGTVALFQLNDTTYVGTKTINSYTTYNRALISAIPSKTQSYVPCKVHEADDLYSAQKSNQFYSTSEIEPSLDQTYDFFIIYSAENFIVTRHYFDYIRKPRSISLVLGQNCELADTTHHKIVDLAVEILRLDTKDQAYPQTVQDIQLRTN